MFILIWLKVFIAQQSFAYLYHRTAHDVQQTNLLDNSTSTVLVSVSTHMTSASCTNWCEESGKVKGGLRIVVRYNKHSQQCHCYARRQPLKDFRATPKMRDVVYLYHRTLLVLIKTYILERRSFNSSVKTRWLNQC